MGDRGDHLSGHQPHAFFLVGPTASGKSRVAQHIAEREGLSIVSADSMNIYRGMDIGTAKPSAAERRRVAYAGIDLTDPMDKFTVAQYIEAVKPIFCADRPVLVSGGTGLYVKCLTEGFDEVPPENTKLRAELETLDFHALQRRAREDAPELYEGLTADDRQNPRRLIRILERTAAGSVAGRDGSPNRPLSPRSWNENPKPTLVGLRVARELLHQRIEKRVESMYADGLLDEASALMKRQLSQTAMQAIGYAEAFAVLKNEISEVEAKEKTVIRTRQLAKRQMTWFRNQLKVEWIDVAAYPDPENLAEAVSNAWKQLGPVPIILN
jgi:tRNA dimethylallyltransferase